MEKLYRILSKVAYTTHPVLILGETGSGKGQVARAIHSNGPRAAEPFHTVDCTASPSSVESELFGDAQPVSATADVNGIGLLASVGGGTVLLDEIGDLPLELQTKLLRALQERAIRPAGAAEALPLTARILASSSRDLHAMVESGRFRRDLFFRLNVVNLRVPPLRERKGDLPLLAAQILCRFREEKDQAYSFAEEAIRLLMAYDWPGNLRELEHAIERACLLSSGPVLHLGDLPTQLQDARMHQQALVAANAATADASSALPLDTEPSAVVPIAEIEKQAILRTLRQLNGDKLLAARLLGIGKTTLYRKLKEYELAHDEL
jgi:two-component system response regulator HydG